MEINVRPMLYYLVKRGEDTIIVKATDAQMVERYEKGERWHGVPYKTLEEAEAALPTLNSN